MALQGLPEYDSNACISRLPPIRAMMEVQQQFAHGFRHAEDERQLQPHIRIHCVMRLRHFLMTFTRHVALEAAVSVVIRQGYIGRDPEALRFGHKLELARKLFDGEPALPHVDTCAMPASFALIGTPGLGKTVSIKRILSAYEQVHEHTTPVSFVQVVWLKVDCPDKGSALSLCHFILIELDRLLGTTYFDDYVNTKRTAPQLIAIIANLFLTHAVGVLVVDEIQNLIRTRDNTVDNKHELIRFLTLLVNSVGVPVILVGTYEAKPIFEAALHTARRASGMGSQMWEPLAWDDEEWVIFVEELWRGQWTSPSTRLTVPLRNALHLATCGIIDLAVILYILCQVRLMQLTASAQAHNPEYEPDEQITIELIQDVANESFRLVEPMLRALRSGEEGALAMFKELRDVHDGFQAEVDRAKLVTAPRIAHATTAEPNNAPEKRSKAAELLHGAGFARDVVEAALAQIGKDADTLNSFELVARLATVLGAIKPKPAKKPRTLRSKLSPEDVRRIVSEGKIQGLQPCASLRRAGYIRPLSDFFPA